MMQSPHKPDKKLLTGVGSLSRRSEKLRMDGLSRRSQKNSQREILMKSSLIFSKNLDSRRSEKSSLRRNPSCQSFIKIVT